MIDLLLPRWIQAEHWGMQTQQEAEEHLQIHPVQLAAPCSGIRARRTQAEAAEGT